MMLQLNNTAKQLWGTDITGDALDYIFLGLLKAISGADGSESTPVEQLRENIDEWSKYCIAHNYSASDFFKWGFGGNHLWVKQLDDCDNCLDDDIIFVDFSDYQVESTDDIIKKIQEEVQGIVDNDSLDWSVKYDKVFSSDISERVSNLIELDYYDPDTTYEEDVRAFASALYEYVN